MANQTCSKKPLKPYAPPFYPSTFNHHHASIANRTNKWSVHFPVATGPRNCVVPNRKPKDKPRFNEGAKRLFIKKQHHREIWKYHVCITRKSWPLFKSKKIAQVVRARIQGKNSLVKHFEDMRLCRPSKEYLQVWFDPPRDGSMSCLTTKGMCTIGAVCARRFRESLRRVTDGAEAFLILTLFILCLDKVSTDHAKLVPLGKVCTAKETLEKNTAKGTKCKLEPLISLTDDLSLLSNMAALESCPKHNMIAYLEKTEGNVEFHEVIDFLRRSYIYHALTVSPVVSTTFVEQFWTSAKSKTINNVRHITAKVAGKVVSISEASIRTDLIFDDADGIDSLPNQAIFNVSDQAKEIKFLKAQITKLKNKDLKEKLLKKQRMPQNVCIQQGRKKANRIIIKKDDEDKEFDEVRLSTEDELDMTIQSSKVSTDEQIEGADDQVESTEEKNEGTEEIFGSTEEQRPGTEEKVESTAGQIEGTEDQTKEELATQASQTSTQTPTSMIFGDDETIATLLLNMSKAKAVSKEKEKGVELKDVEEIDRPRPTSQRSLLTLKPLPKIDPKDKGKKKIEEEDESESEDDDIPQAVKKFKQLESDEELARKVQEEWEAEEERNRLAEEKATNEALIKNFDDIKARIEADRILAEKLQEQEREQFTIEERAKFLHDTIAAQRKFLAQQRSEAIRNRPPTKNQLRNQMMTYLKHVGNFKHSELKSKKFEDIQAMYEKIKRSDEDFIAIGSVEDDRLIKRMNKKDSSKGEEIKQESKEEVKEEDKGEENTRKRKHGTRKKMKSRKRRFKQDTSQDDPSDIEKENDELRLCLTIAPDEDKEVDYEILDKKYPIIDWKTENLGTKPQFDESKRSEEINMNVVTRSNGQKR
ncbi:ribonuclease H-like domain-containing protein [Tanacetum coccineum]